MLLCFGSAAFAQRKQLYNDTALYPVFEQLKAADSKTGILQLGDSHVQAGFLPNAVAKKLKERFGDAGAGWVFPYNLAGTNGPDGYRWSSSIRWSADRVVDRGQTYWPGPGGIVLFTSQARPALSFSSKQGDNISRIKIFYDAGAAKAPVQMTNAAIAQEDTDFPENAQLGIITPDSSVSAFQLRWPDHTGGVFRFYGALLENDENGILYSAIGINGAQLMHYNQHEATLPAQLSAVRPQLVIISLGTNEAFGGVSASDFKKELNTAVKAVQTYAPGARLLFTTPPYGMKKKRSVPYKRKVGKKIRTAYRVSFVTNTQVAVLKEVLVDYCRENGHACWDFYEVMKTDTRFARGWSNDRIHFNAYGYTLQGTLLSEAILSAYDAWMKK